MSTASPPQHVEVLAATLVIFRQSRPGPPELLMVVRSKEMSFAGGAAVFPGGRVDPEDLELARKLDHGCENDDEAAHRIAAVRETLEETGLALGLAPSASGEVDGTLAAEARDMALEHGALAPVLDHFGWSLDLDALVPFARWVPRGLSHERIFDTRFYLADLGTGAVDISVDATENTKLFWATAQEALDMAERGDISIIFPTRRNLERLALFGDFAAARTHAEAIPVQPITPQIVGEGADQMLTIPGDAGYPITVETLEKAMRG